MLFSDAKQSGPFEISDSTGSRNVRAIIAKRRFRR